MIGDFGGEVMFGTDADLRGWNERLEAGTAEVSWWTWGKRGKAPIGTPGRQNAPYLPVVSLHRKRTCEPVTTKTKVRKGTRVAFLIDQDRAEESNTELAAAGWKSA